jgi:ABC-2 type transport system permease protein
VDNLSTARQEFFIYRRLVSARLQGQMRYKTSFILQIFGNFAINFVELVAIFILFQHFDSLAGWRVGDIAFLYALSTIPFGIAHVVGSGFTVFQQQIKLGDFDRVLTRPVSPFVQVLSSELLIYQLGRVVQGVVALGIALTLIDIDWTIGRVLYLIVSIFSAAVLFTALFTLEATLCFWTTEGTEAVNAFTYGGTTLAQYPLQIYGDWLRRLFLWIIPLGLVIFEPALYLLDKPDPLGLPAFARFVAPVAAILFAVGAGFLWRTGVLHYRSTGS